MVTVDCMQFLAIEVRFIHRTERPLVSMVTVTFNMHWVHLIIARDILRWKWSSGHCIKMGSSWQSQISNRNMSSLSTFNMDVFISTFKLDKVMPGSL